MRDGELAPFGGGGGIVEIDETYQGHNPDARTDVKRLNWVQKNAVLTLIDRDSGRARSMVVEGLNAAKVAEILSENVAKEARLRTDEAKFYITPAKAFAEHGVVAHARDEYVSRTDPSVHTNTVEGFYSIFKRGMRGVYQHCSKKLLHRYAAEFDFRYSNRVAVGVDDSARAVLALQGAIGKRLTYQMPDRQSA